jgi:hypothetical protein
MSEPICNYTIKQGGIVVAAGSGPRSFAEREAAHYALVYGQDGPVEMKIRKSRALAALQPKEGDQ